MARCRICKNHFEKRSMAQVVCGIACAQAYAKLKREKELADHAKAQRKKLKEEKERIKTRGDWLKEAQAAFNRYIRQRDEGLPCISCGRHHKGQVHAGHYMATSIRPELRFDERNVHLQCAPCNMHMHGNLIMYRIGLIDRIGLAEVEELEGPSTYRKYTSQELKSIKETYQQKYLEVKRGNQ